MEGVAKGTVEGIYELALWSVGFEFFWAKWAKKYHQHSILQLDLSIGKNIRHEACAWNECHWGVISRDYLHFGILYLLVPNIGFELTTKKG